MSIKESYTLNELFAKHNEWHPTRCAHAQALIDEKFNDYLMMNMIKATEDRLTEQGFVVNELQLLVTHVQDAYEYTFGVVGEAPLAPQWLSRTPHAPYMKHKKVVKLLERVKFHIATGPTVFPVTASVNNVVLSLANQAANAATIRLHKVLARCQPQNAETFTVLKQLFIEDNDFRFSSSGRILNYPCIQGANHESSS